MENGLCFVQDVGSRFGTFVNGERILPVQDAGRREAGRFDHARRAGAEARAEHSRSGIALREPRGVRGRRRDSEDRSSRRPRRPVAAADAHLIKLFAEMGRTLVSAQSLPDILNRVVDMAFAAVPAERAFLLLRDSSDAALEARVLRQRDGTAPTNATLSRAIVRRVMRERVAILASRRHQRSRPCGDRQHPAVQHPVVHVRAAVEPGRGDWRAVPRQPEAVAVCRRRSRYAGGADQRGGHRDRTGASDVAVVRGDASGASGSSATIRPRS